jgi:CRP/FNR family transcriptional regulator, cyclic AMP receptor protein
MAIKATMVSQKLKSVNWMNLVGGTYDGSAPVECRKNHRIYHQGDRANSLYYLRRGQVRLGVKSGQGKVAIVAVLSAGEFFGEGCLAGQSRRTATATATRGCTLMRIEKRLMVRMLHEQHDISEIFGTLLLSRNMLYESNLLDQIFNSSEKRLARILLLLAHYGREPRSRPVLPNINQEILAQTVGISRSRVSHLLNKFKKLGFIKYERVELKVNNSLLSVVLNG